LGGGRIDYGVHGVLADVFGMFSACRFGYAWRSI
jgi:hypothetical protein